MRDAVFNLVSHILAVNLSCRLETVTFSVTVTFQVSKAQLLHMEKDNRAAQHPYNSEFTRYHHSTANKLN